MEKLAPKGSRGEKRGRRARWGVAAGERRKSSAADKHQGSGLSQEGPEQLRGRGLEPMLRFREGRGVIAVAGRVAMGKGGCAIVSVWQKSRLKCLRGD